MKRFVMTDIIPFLTDYRSKLPLCDLKLSGKVAEFYFRYKKKNKQTIKSQNKNKKQNETKNKSSVFKPCELKLLMIKDKICDILQKFSDINEL